jgi:type II secretory pathway component PulF
MMPEKNYKKFLPSFLILFFELLSHWKRDFSHNNNLKKMDKTAEQLGTIEHMLVRLEKKIQYNRDLVDKLKTTLYFSMAVNLILLIVIFLKVFSFI